MDIKVLQQNIDLLACPECGKSLELVSADQKHLLMCNICNIVHPVIDGIPVILTLTTRNPSLEAAAIKQFAEINNLDVNVKRACLNTIGHLNSIPEADGWEWEDEKHWSAVYENRMAETPAEARWNARQWQRQPIIDPILKAGDLASKRILDIGCGEGQNFRLFFKNTCKKDCIYIAADISMNALLLNRTYNKKTETAVLYVLCSADNLPFQRTSVDIVCFFGILHHSRLKEKNIALASKLVKSSGWIVIHEAVQRFTKPRKPAAGESAHEERINPVYLKNAVYGLRDDFDIAYEGAFFTIFYLVAAKCLGSLMDRHRWIYRSVEMVDIILARLFGRVIPIFKPSEQRYLLHKK